MKKYLYPPQILLVIIMLIILSWYFLPGYNLIAFPYNLSGILLLIFAIIISGKGNTKFHESETPHDFKKPLKLIKDGIFEKTRNPLYIGMICLVLGIAVISMNVFSILLSIIYFLILNFYFIPVEEKMLTEIFGHEYVEYRGNVRRWF